MTLRDDVISVYKSASETASSKLPFVFTDYRLVVETSDVVFADI